MMASNYLSPLNTKLDAAQVIRRAYDEPNNRLRVDAEVTATIGTVDVIIDAASGDNIKISDGVNTLSINPDGSINISLDNTAVTVSNSTIQVPWDQVTIATKDSDGQPLLINYKLNSVLVAQMTLTYDIDGDFSNYTVTYI